MTDNAAKDNRPARHRDRIYWSSIESPESWTPTRSFDLSTWRGRLGFWWWRRRNAR